MTISIRTGVLAGLACFGAAGMAASADPTAAAAPPAPKAQEADPQALNRLAMRYRDGQGVPRDHKESLRLSRLAADQEDAVALDNVGFHYYQGWGVPQNFDIAAAYFKAGAAAGSPWATFNLGRCYFGGQGVEQDLGRAVDCWKRAAEMGHGMAATYVAMAYTSGEGAGPDEAEAVRWAQRAADAGDLPGLVLLGELRFAAGDEGAARRAWEAAAAKGSAEAADLLKLIEWRGRKPEPNRFAFVAAAHVHQGHNTCGATSATMLARSRGAKLTQYDLKRLCPGSPIGTGTDWAELAAAGAKLGQPWKLVTFPPDDGGLRRGTQLLRAELDAGRPVVIDFTVDAPGAPGGKAGHTVTVAGYVAAAAEAAEGAEAAAEDLYVIRDPARPTPGLRLMGTAELGRLWQSAGYSRTANGNARPAIVVDVP